MEAFYDTDLHITWLANGRASQGTAFDDGTLDNDGKLSWSSARQWADSLTLGGANHWRLPSTLIRDPSCSSSVYGGTGQGCTGSEMGHLSNVDLIGPQTPKGFTLYQGDEPNNWYWSQNEIPAEPGGAYVYNLALRVQSGNWIVGGYSAAMAVHDGDVGAAISAVPEPETYALMLAGLVMLGFVGRRSQRRG